MTQVHKHIFAFIIAFSILGNSAAFAEKSMLPNEAPKVFKDVLDCRTIADSTARLSCYDTSVAKLDTAQNNKELYVADKEQVQETNKGLFGFSLPRVKIFGGQDDPNEVKEIDAVIASVREGQRGWVFTLEDGAKWVQTDNVYIGTNPKSGQKIHIKKGALGSFFGKVQDGIGFRIDRQN